MKIGMFEWNSIKTTSFFHPLEKDKPIVFVKNYLLLSLKLGVKQVAITTLERQRNYQRARGRRAKVHNIIFVFGGNLTLSTCLTPNLLHLPTDRVPTVSWESLTSFVLCFVGTPNGRVVFRILQKQTEIWLDSSEIYGFLLQGLFGFFVDFCLFVFYGKCLERSFTWVGNNITKWPES